MEVRLEQQPIPNLVVVSGEVDHYVAPRLTTQIDKLLADGAAEIAVDLRKVTYIDSGGISVLFTTMQQLAKKEGRLIVISQNNDVNRILSMVGITEKEEFKLYRSMEEALSALGGPKEID